MVYMGGTVHGNLIALDSPGGPSTAIVSCRRQSVGTTYSKGGPSAAALMVPPDCPWQLTIAVEGPPGPSTAENVAVDGWSGGTSYRMTYPLIITHSPLPLAYVTLQFDPPPANRE